MFLLKILQKMWRRNCSQTLFKKIRIERFSGSIVLSFVQFVIIVCQVENYRNVLKLSCWPLAFTLCKAFFLKKKKEGGLELVFLPHFLHHFWRKMFFMLYSITWPNFSNWLILLREGFGKYCLLTRLWGHTFWN